jgi:penicillin-binding protein 1C
MTSSAVRALSLCALLCCAAAPALEPPKASTLVTDRFGRPLRSYLDGGGEAACVPLKLGDISPWLVLATVAAEDKRFFTHPGVDFMAAARAFAQNASSGRTVSGASTITQQLARALEPRPRTMFGKVREMFSALRLEARHSKEEILESYFNGVSYGPLLTGAGAASLDYFGSPAAALTPAQAALLAAIPKSPVNYDPRRRPAAAEERRRLVLRRMSELGLIGEEAYRLALAEKPAVREKERFFSAPHFADKVLRQGGSGGTITTTLDGRVQEAAALALRNRLAGLAGRNHVKNGAVLVLDNATGGVLAWVGSADFFDKADGGQVDGVTALRQPGSALKPFLYGLALSKGARASDLVDDSPLYSAAGHAPENYDRSYHGPVRLREALACSYNVPAVRLAQKAGVPDLLAKLHDFGFASLAKPAEFYGEGLALGNGEVTLLELTAAYAALARGGIWLPARLTPGQPAEARRALGRGEAYIVTSMLSDNAARAPAFGVNSAFNLPFDLAAKTGTTKDYRDNWAAGYTPEWTIGVWVGNFSGAPMRRVSGITGAAPVLRDVALEMKKLYGSSPFRRPPGIRTARVCPVSGLPPSAFCPSSMEEVFLASRLPAGQCAAHNPAAAAAAPSPRRPGLKFPVNGDIFRIDPQTPRAAQALVFRAEGAGPEAVWRVDGRELAERGEAVSWPLAPGKHTVSFSAPGAGASRPIVFTVVE